MQVLYTAFKRKFKEPVKVVQFAGAVLETAAYHHGDAALQGAIIAMARRYAFQSPDMRLKSLSPCSRKQCFSMEALLCKE